MKTMSCESARELLPLHVAGDLEGSHASEVAAHVSQCAGCRALAAEFDESRSLLAEACAPPEFGADFYAGVRSAVLAEITSERRTPSGPSFFAALFSRRLVHATTFALLFLACLLALQHLRRATRETPQQIVRDTNDRSREKASAANAASPSPEDSTTWANSRRDDGGRDYSGRRSLFIKAKHREGESRPDVRARRDALTTQGTPHKVRDEVADAPRASLDPARTLIAHARSSVETASTRAPEVSRIEIQTADPNIRIIWLTPLKAEEPSPDHDNHENGDRN
jgi:hypothetical protein